ncbi:MAG TPA: hypothetical protein VH331_12215 [Allosphingosinicella sp.]|nr:hypothetical protein [Allosphingosinicella sp.]
MRYPTTHRFLKWFGPTFLTFCGGCLLIIAAFAQASKRADRWAEAEFDYLRPIVTTPSFLAVAALIIAAYLVATFWTGRPAKQRFGVTLWGAGLEHVRVEPSHSGPPKSWHFPISPSPQPKTKTAPDTSWWTSLGEAFKDFAKRIYGVDDDGLSAMLKAARQAEEAKQARAGVPNIAALVETRRTLIAKGRNLVHRFRTSVSADFERFASHDRDYLDLQPHLGDDYQAWRARNAGTIFQELGGDGGDDYRAAMLLRELARLEKEWGLA